ncbi:MAG: AAA family ATPase [Polyangiaceae bacterium]|nr:AAA family ATPase [Polyangiaceae bacterium]
MSGSDLQELTITNLRGYVEPFSLTFDKQQKLCIVYGENGTGKSTLCDALELLCTDKIGSLEGRGLGKTERYLAPLGGTGTGSVELKTSGPVVYTASLNAGRVARAPNAPRIRVLVLRRPQLLKLINATAAERYGEIASLVDVSGIETSEAALAKLEKGTDQSTRESTARLAGAKQILEDLFNVAAAAGDPIAWARKEAEADVPTLRAAAARLQTLIEAREALARRHETATAAVHTANAAGVAADGAAKAVAGLERREGGTHAELVSLLDAASRLLAAHGEADACPLCQATTHAAGLRERVDERLTAMRALQTAIIDNATATRIREQAEQAVASERQAYESERQTFVQAQGALAASGAPSAAVAPPPPLPEQLPAWLADTAPAHEQVTQRRATLVTRAENLERLRAALNSYDDDHQIADRATKLLGAVRAAHERVRSTRHAFVNGVLEQISEEVGRLYEQVHPGEGLGKISLALDANRRASLDLSTSFQTAAAVPPQAYLSDSHLDTLGMCVFLALAKLRDAPSTILVLDDVLASVDEPHVDRLVELVHREAKGFRHVLVTTHYRPWREKLRWGWLKDGQCQIVELARWAPNVGPTLLRSTAEIERLRRLVDDDDFDPQAACAKAGVVLEAVLDFLTELYGLKLPRRPRGEWTLGDLLPAFGKKLRAALRVEHQEPTNPTSYVAHELGPVIEELQRVAQTRNLKGAHFNKLSFELLDSDAKHFATHVLQLADLLVHPEHGWPRSDKSGSYWACAKDARRLHPLKEPV